MPVFIVAGIAAGLALLLVRISRATSYLSDDPRACINCHIMVPQFATWERSAHARVATCNDCHVPHDSVVRQYAFKAQDGLRHATMFTLRLEPQVIRATPAAEQVIQENCLRCHARQLSRAHFLSAMDRKCISCHREVPHGRGLSLASTPFVRYPALPPVTGP